MVTIMDQYNHRIQRTLHYSNSIGTVLTQLPRWMAGLIWEGDLVKIWEHSQYVEKLDYQFLEFAWVIKFGRNITVARSVLPVRKVMPRFRINPG